MSKDGEIRQTVRIPENRYPDEFAYLLALKHDGGSWAEVFRVIISKAMQFDMGDPQLSRIERELSELKKLLLSQPVVAIEALGALPPEEKVPTVNPFGKEEVW